MFGYFLVQHAYTNTLCTLCKIQLFLKSKGKFVNNLKPKMVNEQREPFPPLWARRGAYTLPKITLVLAIVK